MVHIAIIPNILDIDFNERISRNNMKKTDIVLYLYLLVSVVVIMFSDYIDFYGADVFMFLWKGVLVTVMLKIAYDYSRFGKNGKRQQK